MTNPPNPEAAQALKTLLAAGDPGFAGALAAATAQVAGFAETLQLATMRRRALAKGVLPAPARSRRIAMVGGANLHPLVDLIEHFAAVLGDTGGTWWTGDYDNYISEILDPASELYSFAPEVVLLLPAERRCVFNGSYATPRDAQQQAARATSDELLALCNTLHERLGAETVLANFRLTPYFDPGPMRATSLASDYAFRRAVNTELGAALPSHVHLVDLEFLSARRGNLEGVDDRTWFESKQPFAAGLLTDAAREFAHVLCGLGRAAKKVAVLDLDNTLWGGVIGDDGLEGIELGTTSPRGEAFRDFQQALLALAARGVLLAVCSKNDYDKAAEPFLKHPEMVLKLDHITSFYANWEPKSDNIRRIAQELNVGLDSLVFFDDNRAEIEIVNQFVPEAATVWVGDDPSLFAAKLKDSRYFEHRTITAEDLKKGEQYRQLAEGRKLAESSTDMDSYLTSLEMVGPIHAFNLVDAPRIAQLIAKSNQFNLTTRRRTEAEVQALIADPAYRGFTMRLADRFGDHGLIAIVVGQIVESRFEVDTWLMSCRVLKRQVEEEVLNEIVRLAVESGCSCVVGRYLPTAKNGMVKELYPTLGFSAAGHEAGDTDLYTLSVANYVPKPTKISVRHD